MSHDLMINNWKILVNPNGLFGEWLTADEIGTHLGYAEPSRSVNNLYERNSSFFKDGVDTCVIKLMTQSQVRDVRVFSERGTLKILRYSKTDLADQVMEEVFDVFIQVRKAGQIPEKYANNPMVLGALKYQEIVLKHVQFEEEQKRQALLIQNQQQKVQVLEAKTDAVLSQSGFFTVLGYANAFEYKNLTLEKAAKIGKQATRISESLGIAVTTVPDPRFGRINQYRKEVLDEIFAKVFDKNVV